MEKNKCECCSIKNEIRSIKTVEDAMIALSILGISSDGRVNSREIDAIYKILNICPIFKNISKPKEKYLNCIISYISNKKRDDIIKESINVIPSDLRSSAYAWIYFALKSDKNVLKPEHEFLNAITKSFKIPGPLAGKIKAVVEIISRDK